MRVCAECFEDSRLRDYILRQGEAGDCDLCGADDVDSVEAQELVAMFEPILSYYKPYDPEEEKSGFLASLLDDAPPYVGSLHDVLQRDWRFFSPRTAGDGRERLLVEIMHGRAKDQPSPSSLWIPRDASLRHMSLVKRWQAFSRHLRDERRFIPDETLPELGGMRGALEKALSVTARMLDSGFQAYRARRGYRWPKEISLPPRKEPIAPAEMGPPPRDRAMTAGRLSPPGIRFLYLSLDRDTAVAETRPPKGAAVSVAVFETVRPIRIADLTAVEPLESPFGVEDVLWEVESRDLLSHLSSEFAEPIDPEKEPVEYVPTQFAAEAIRNSGFDGIIYKSALGASSNLALFDPGDARPLRSELFEIAELRYEVEPYDPMRWKIPGSWAVNPWRRFPNLEFPDTLLDSLRDAAKADS